MEANFEERLLEEIRKHRNLYDTSRKDYKDFQGTKKSWDEVAVTVGKDAAVCKARWRCIRNRFVRVRKKVKGKSETGASGGVPPILHSMSWLDNFIKYRKTNVPTDFSCGSGGVPSPACSSSNSSNQWAPSPSCSSSSNSSNPLAPSPSGSHAISPACSEFPAPPAPRQSSPPGTSTPNTTKRGRKRRRREEASAKKEDVLMKRLEAIDRRRAERDERALLKDDEETRFALTIADMLKKLPSEVKSHARFRIHKLLYNIEQGYACQQSCVRVCDWADMTLLLPSID